MQAAVVFEVLLHNERLRHRCGIIQVKFSASKQEQDNNDSNPNFGFHRKILIHFLSPLILPVLRVKLTFYSELRAPCQITPRISSQQSAQWFADPPACVCYVRLCSSTNSFLYLSSKHTPTACSRSDHFFDRLVVSADFHQLLFGKLDLTFWQHVQYERLPVRNRRSMIGPRLKYTPTPGRTVKSSAFSNGHNHAYLARWMAVVRANQVF